MARRRKRDWSKVDWRMTDEEIANICRCTVKYVRTVRWELFGPTRHMRRGTFGVRVNLTEELNTAIRRAAGKSGLSFSEWMRRAAEMKLAAEEGVHG